jgi:phage gp36-like protein
VIYATVQDVREALAPEGDFTNTATAASLLDSQLTDALVEASSEVDAAVRGAPYTSGTIPAVVQAIVRDIAAYLATLTHRKGLELPNDHPVALRYKRAEALLAAAQAGKLDLSVPPTSEGVAGEVAIANGYEGDLFDLETMGIGVDNRVLPPWNGGSWWGWP